MAHHMNQAPFDTLKSLHPRTERLPGMKPFKGDTDLRCPWLHWCLGAASDTLPDGILMLQDWGNAEESFDQAIETLDDCLGNYSKGQNLTGEDKDQTLKKLFDPKRKWGYALKSGRILVMNAAWGLRASAEKCGYMGAATHKAAFFTWVKVVRAVAEQNENFCLYVAGEWATFDDGNNPTNLSDYLEKWNGWASRGRGRGGDKIEGLEKCRGKVVYLRHPCLWGSNDGYEKSPWESM